MTTDTTLPGTTSTLFNVPKLAEDGSNWITYKERTLTAISARGLMRYVDGRAVEPLPYAISTLTGLLEKPDGSNLVKQQVFSTITDRLLLRVQKLESASEVWAEICQIHEDKTELVQIDFAEMLRLRELLAGMGAGILDTDFHAMILGSLPESYRPLLSSINAASKITKTPLSSERRPNKKGGSALVAREAASIVTERDIIRQIVGVQGEGRKGKGQISNGRRLIRDRSRPLMRQLSRLTPPSILLWRRGVLSWTRERHPISAPIVQSFLTSSLSLPKRSTQLTARPLMQSDEVMWT